MTKIYAQEMKKDTVLVVTADTVKTKKKGAKVHLEIGGKQYGTKQDSTEKNEESGYPDFSLSLTFTRFDLGFSRYLDNGSFSLSPQNDYLDYTGGKTSNIGFDFLQLGVRFTSHFKVYLAAGLDWNHIRLEKNITFQKNKPLDQYITEPIEFDKNRFSSRYLRLPLSFEFRTNDDRKGKKIHFVAGPEIGFLLNGKLKQISNERGKEKFYNDYNFQPVRYGAFARLGYGGMGIYAKYYFTDVFVEGQGPKDFKNFSFGLMFGF